MPKNLLQDMVKIKRINRETLVGVKLNQKLSQKESKKKNHKYILWFVASVSFIILIFAFSQLFAKALITVNPKKQDIVLNKDFSAIKDVVGNDLSFNLVFISGEENQTIQATEEKNVSLKAKGVIMIYNTFSSSSQILNIDTKLEGSNKKIYQTDKRVIVPGITKDGKPGSVEVGIYAKEVGVEYNSKPIDFKIVNFKGTSKYDKFYGRSKGAITGGFVGKLPVIMDDQKQNFIDKMKVALQAKLVAKATDQIPNGFILFKNAVFLDIDDQNIDFTSFEDKILPLKLKGTLYGFLFNEDKLTKKIAEASIEKYDGSGVSIPNVRDLAFSLSKKDSTSFLDVKNINFNLSGNTKIVWNVDNDKFTNDLLGKSKSDFNTILLNYPNIKSANLDVSPFWKTSIPDNALDIKVIVNNP